MTASLVARKCTQCAGKLQYIKEKKIWKCLYCGAEIEREEQYDGLFTIKNVVRQSLLDTAYRRLDSALKNLLECEKIDSKYVGTLIAKISHEMITLITPGACSERDAKNILTQLKKNYDQLKSLGSSITDEEEALYEFLEESDIYATLILVFDSLNDAARRDYAEALLNAGEVYSKAANGNLLTYAIKNKKMNMVDSIISNAANIDVKSAIAEVFQKYPDSESKGKNIEKLFAVNELKNEDKPIVEKYLSESQDGISTKVTTAVAALDSGMKVSLELITDNVLRKADKDQVIRVVSAICKNKLTDDEVLHLVEFAFSSGIADISFGVLDCLKQSGQYLLVPARLMISMLNMSAYSAAEKAAILDKCFEFKVENKATETVVTNYLCYNSSPVEERKAVIECLFSKAAAFPTTTVETYILKCSTDGEEKKNVVAAMFEKGLNVSFFNDLLSRYMKCSTDSKETKSAVVDILSEKGMKIDPGSFIDYICESSDELPVKMQFIRKMMANGSQLRGDAANTYIEKVLPEQFSSELFSLIFTPGSTFSAKAIEKYLLQLKDREANKTSNLKTIIGHSAANIAAVKCEVLHLGNRIACNLLQGYLLTTTDSQQLAFEIVDYLLNNLKLKINAEITYSGNTMKLKKYVAANKSNLSSVTNAVCEKYKVYSMLF